MQLLCSVSVDVLTATGTVSSMRTFARSSFQQLTIDRSREGSHRLLLPPFFLLPSVFMIFNESRRWLTITGFFFYRQSKSKETVDREDRLTYSPRRVIIDISRVGESLKVNCCVATAVKGLSWGYTISFLKRCCLPTKIVLVLLYVVLHILGPSDRRKPRANYDCCIQSSRVTGQLLFRRIVVARRQSISRFRGLERSQGCQRPHKSLTWYAVWWSCHVSPVGCCDGVTWDDDSNVTANLLIMFVVVNWMNRRLAIEISL